MTPGLTVHLPQRPHAVDHRSSTARRRAQPLSPAFHRLVERAHRSRERQVLEIVARCRRLYPHYRALTGPALEGLRQNVRNLVAGFYQRVLIAGRVATAQELEPTVRMVQLRVVGTGRSRSPPRLRAWGSSSVPGCSSPR